MKLRKAVLLIHGFAGGTYDMESLAWQLTGKFDVYQFTLPGHGYKEKKVSTCEEWVKSSEQKIETLIKYGYKKIYVVGHSMGGVLACHLASKYKEVKKVVTAAAAFKYIAEKENFSLEKTKEILEDYGLEEIKFRMLDRLPLTASLEFKKLIEEYQDTPKNINVPILIVQGLKDDIVPTTSAEYIYDNVLSAKKGIIYLSEANHSIFLSSQAKEINERIEKFLKNSKISQDKEYIYGNKTNEEK